MPITGRAHPENRGCSQSQYQKRVCQGHSTENDLARLSRTITGEKRPASSLFMPLKAYVRASGRSSYQSIKQSR